MSSKLFAIANLFSSLRLLTLPIARPSSSLCLKSWSFSSWASWETAKDCSFPFVGLLGVFGGARTLRSNDPEDFLYKWISNCWKSHWSDGLKKTYFYVIADQKLTFGRGEDLDSCSDSLIAIAMSFSSCCLGVKAESLENISDRLGAGWGRFWPEDTFVDGGGRDARLDATRFWFEYTSSASLGLTIW